MKNNIEAPVDTRKSALLMTTGWAVLLWFTLATAATADVVIRNLDSANEGFNDTTVVNQIGGNTGTTLGRQRLNVFNRAAAIISDMIISPVNIVVGAAFDPLTCSSSGAILGSAGPSDYEFEEIDSGFNMYPQALFNSLTGRDGNGSDIEIKATFNTLIDDQTCLGATDWYYGFDDNSGRDTSLLSVVLHELIHGMGFLSLLQPDGRSGAYFEGNSGRVEIYDEFTKQLYSAADRQSVTQLTQAQRAAALRSNDKLLWNGQTANKQAKNFTSGITDNKFQMYAPSTYNSGSSVSHFARALSPNELMEPSYSGFTDSIGAARHILQDIGWAIREVEVNEAPEIIGLDSIQLNEDTQFTTLLKVIDVNDDPTQVSIKSADSQLNASLSGYELRIAPTLNYFGQGSITLTTSDGTQSRDTIIPVSVLAVNDAPQLAPIANIRLAEDDAKSYQLQATDADSDRLNFFISNSTSALNAAISNNRLVIEPERNFFGSGQVTVRVSDGTTTDSQTVSVTINPVNDAPVFLSPTTITANRDEPTQIRLSALDVDGDNLSYSIILLNNNILSAAIQNNLLTITPKSSTNRSTYLYMAVTDGVIPDFQYITINWSDSSTNSAPLVQLDNQSVLLNQITSLPLIVSDAENNIVTLEIDTTQTAAELNARLNGQTLTVNPQQTGQYDLTLVASDGKTTINKSVQISVSNEMTIAVAGQNYREGDRILTSGEQLPLTLSNAANVAQLTIDFNGQRLNNTIDKEGNLWTLDLSGNKAFAGTYTITITDTNGYSAVFYIERSPSIALVTSPFLAINEPQPVIIRGVSENTTLELSTNQTGIVWCNQDGEIINWVELGRLNNPGELMLYLKYENTPEQARREFARDSGQLRQARLSLSSTTIPSSALDIDVLATQTVDFYVTDPRGLPLEDALLSIDEPKMLAWGLESSVITNYLGEAQVEVPMQDTPARLLPPGMVPVPFVIKTNSNRIDLNVADSNARYWLIGSVAGEFNFYNELPEVIVTLDSGINLKPLVTLQTREQASFLWSTNFEQGRPQQLTLKHPQASTRVLSLDSGKDIESISARLDTSPTTINIAAADSGGSSGGAVSSWFWLVSFGLALLLARSRRVCSCHKTGALT